MANKRMTTGVRLRIKAELTLLLLSVIVVEVFDMVAAIGVGFKYSDVPSIDLVAFHVATMALVNYWVRVDARSAFNMALKERHVRCDGVPLRVVFVDDDE
jgi:hypothetical protein